jgi:hypothetical protein
MASEREVVCPLELAHPKGRVKKLLYLRLCPINCIGSETEAICTHCPNLRANNGFFPPVEFWALSQILEEKEEEVLVDDVVLKPPLFDCGYRKALGIKEMHKRRCIWPVLDAPRCLSQLSAEFSLHQYADGVDGVDTHRPSLASGIQ